MEDTRAAVYFASLITELSHMAPGKACAHRIAKAYARHGLEAGTLAAAREHQRLEHEEADNILWQTPNAFVLAHTDRLDIREAGWRDEARKILSAVPIAKSVTSGK